MMGFWDDSGIICKQSAPRSRQIHSITQFFTGRMLFPTLNQQCQSTEGNSITEEDHQT